MKSSKLTMQYAIVDDLRKKGSFKVNKREMCRPINSDITIGTHFGHELCDFMNINIRHYSANY